MSKRKVTLKRITAALAPGAGSDYPGFCLGCGADATGVEPDARAYECESCGAHQVYGAEECLLMVVA